MRTLILISAVVIIAAAYKSEKYSFQLPIHRSKANFEEGVFYTELDHFRPQDDKTVLFSFVLNREHYIAGGPLFFFINDAGTFSTQWLRTGLMYDIAKELGAALFTSDHRYFGENLPTENASFQNLQYLTIDQSLSDIAYFIKQAKDYIKAPNAKVIVWGSGYGGTLAALAREKYPHLIDGAWSSSGLYSLSPRTGDTHYHLSRVIESVSQECADNVKKIFNQITYLVDHNGGLDLKNAFNLCSPVDTNSDLNTAVLFDYLFTSIADYLNIYHYNGIQNFCYDLQNSELESLGKWLDHVYGNEGCRNITYANKIQLGTIIEWNEAGTESGFRQWYYYKCTQYGMFEISHRLTNETLFGQGISETYHYYSCKDLFGSEYEYEALYDAIADFDIIYGNTDNYETTNVIFINGLVDRWYPHAITNLIHNDHSIVMNIPYYARSADLYSKSQYDTEDLIKVKESIHEWIVRWSQPDEPEPLP